MNERITTPLKSLLRRILHVAALPFPPAGARVLIYHSVDEHGSAISISPELFRRQMAWLAAKGYTTWPASRFAAALRAGERLPRKLTVLTFDDGYLNNLTAALPILEQHGLCATLFMVTRNSGEVPRWPGRDGARIDAMIDALFPGNTKDKARASAAVAATLGERIATWRELRGAPARGLELLSHTCTHPYIDAVDDAQLEEELRGSKADLDERGFGPCECIAWPYGMYDDRALAAAVRTGYTATFLGEYLWHLRDHPDPLRICRVGADPSRGVFGLAFVLGRGYDWLQWLRRWKPRRTY